MSDLFPCPFCGGRPSKRMNQIDFIDWPYIACDECDAEIPAVEGDFWNDVCERWNRRIPVAPHG